MKKTILFILILLSILVLTIRFGEWGARALFGFRASSGINVLSLPAEAVVYLDNDEVGKTPYEDKDLEPKEYTLRIEKEKLAWQGKIRLNAGAVTVINRDLAEDQASSAGEVLNLEKGGGITIISNPDGAAVEVDGKPYGVTPISLKLDSGEYIINLSHPGYLKRSIRALLPQDYRLIISADLALSEADLTTVTTPPITATPQVLVKDTPTGFLRVRDKPSLAGKEIAQVKPGDALILLEELPSWYRVRLSDNTEGYVSSSYVEKKSQEEN